MRAELGPRTIGRLAGGLLVGSGVLAVVTLPLPQPPGSNARAILILSIAAVALGVVAYFTPWDRWSRKATLVLLPLAFSLIAGGNYFGSTRPYSYAIFFVVAFVWIGMSHPRWTSLWFAPMAAVAYMLPILLRPDAEQAEAAGVLLAIPVCVLTGELIAWVVSNEGRSRRQAHALARVSSALAHHLNESLLCQTLVEEARSALLSEHAVLYQVDPDTLVIDAVYTSGVDKPTNEMLQRLKGSTPVAVSPEMAAGKPIVIEDTNHGPEGSENLRRFNVKSCVAIPVMARGSLVGVLSCWETSGYRRYEPDEVELAGALAGQASAAFQNARLYEQTLEASRCDALTGLGNRRSFRERLESEVERARRYGRDLSLVLLDADHFKAINDALGHTAGDRALKGMGELLSSNRRSEDGAYRIGGDEFALILPETGPQGATVLAERLRRRVERAGLGGEREEPLTVSIGVSSFGAHGINVDELFAKADGALYDVKTTGRNAVAVPPRLGSTGSTMHLGLDIESIIDKNHLKVFYQPMFELATGQVIAFEAFCRLDPKLGHAPTPTLFRAAAAAGRLEALDLLCRDNALSMARDLMPHVLLFMNASPAALVSGEFRAEEIIGAISRAGFPVERVVVEITEQERTPSSKHLAHNLKLCRQSGLRIALDDFGAAAADLDLLASIEFDFVKVDMSFVQGANGVETRRRVLRGLAGLALETGAKAIAEGIESVDDLRLVQEIGFHAAQGFLLREPSTSLDHSPRPLTLLGTPEATPAPQPS